MQKINRYKIKEILCKELNFINSYKDYIYLLSEDESTDNLDYTFVINHKSSFVELKEKNYSFEDRKRIALEFVKKGDIANHIFPLREKNLIIISDIKYNFFPKVRIDKHAINEILPYVKKYKNYCSLVFSIKELSDDILKQFCVIPFLFSYLDIYIIPYSGNIFFFD